MTCPCGVCEQRFVGCHAECEVYKAWQAEHAAEVKARYEERQKRHIVSGYKLHTTSRKAFLRRKKRK